MNNLNNMKNSMADAFLDKKIEISELIMNYINESRNIISTATSEEHLIKIKTTKDFHLTIIKKCITEDKEIHMILPAFPAKSPNRQKTISHLPDYGEVLALNNLNSLCNKITNIYSKGAKVLICSDGRVFSDVVSVSDKEVSEYNNELKKIIAEQKLNNLSIYSLDDVYETNDYINMRDILINEQAEDLYELKLRIKTDPDELNLFNGMHRFLYEDQKVIIKDKTKNWIRTYSKELAYILIQRSNAWSRLLEKIFPESLRLSIHPQPLHSKKIGVRLLPSNDIWRTPWHSAVVYDGTNYILAPRHSIENSGAQLSLAENKYPFYILKNNERKFL